MNGMRRALRALLGPGSGTLGQGVRYILTGGVVSLVYLLITTFLAFVVGLPFQVALPIGFCAGLAVSFTLQRVFVWAHREEFALPIRRQARRYLALAGTQYGITAASTSLLPAALGLPTAVVYLATAALLTSVNFLFFRHRVFHPQDRELVGALDAPVEGARPMGNTAPARPDGEVAIGVRSRHS